MIAHLRGNLLEKSVDGIVIDVGGVGYEVHVPLSSYCSLPEEGEHIGILIYTHVKEDALKLFGFLTPREKDLFVKLIGVSGVGPKLALNILSGMETDDLIEAIAAGDLMKMSSIPGVGKKTAERLILELKDKVKLESLAGKGREKPAPVETELFDDVVSALMNLGYKKGEIEKTLNFVIGKEEKGIWTFENLLKESLKVISKS